jgi:hypothetical protein
MPAVRIFFFVDRIVSLPASATSTTVLVNIDESRLRCETSATYTNTPEKIDFLFLKVKICQKKFYNFSTINLKMCKIVLNMFEILVFERCQTPGGDNETN